MFSLGSGAGTALSPVLLTCAGLATLAATLISCGSIYIHLKNYRKNVLQRMVVRIMIMIPVYGISSFISIFSLQAAFFIDAIRDVYEAFVIYVFFQLLIAYLGGERSLLILLQGRPPVRPLFPLNLFKRDLDASDPHVYLWLKRGILQYVQVKPVLAIATILLKALGKFDEGDLKAGSGYLYISIIYNVSIAIALYCLAMFWVVVNADLRPFRPMPKFLCVKGILFFSFWQSFFVSILVAAGVVRSLGPYTEASYISLALTDLLICLEMPLFAIAHMYAFSHTDYIDPNLQYCARMPLRYAFRDAFGLKDVIEDSKETLHGKGMDYRSFEPAEGKMHQGSGRDRRIQAGLRYTEGGKQKYWIGAVDRARNWAMGNEESHAPLLENQARDVVRIAPDVRDMDRNNGGFDSDGFSLTYSDPHESDDELYVHSKKYVFGDYNYPCIDVSGEMARRSMWEEEERVLRDQRAAYFSPTLGPRASLLGRERKNYGAAGPSGSQVTPESGGRSGLSPARKKLKGKEVERQPHPILDADLLDEEQIKGAAVIDMDSDRIPDFQAGGVKMKWSKSGKFLPKLQRHESSSLRSPLDHDEGYDSFSSDPESPHSGPSSRSRRLRRSPPSPRAKLPILPHDAVDLIIEDPEAKEERISHERRKGEPTLHSNPGDMKALRKVYRHEDKAEDREGVEASEEGILMDGDATNFQDGKRPQEGTLKEGEQIRSLGGAKALEVTDITAQALTPPLHTRTDVDKYLWPLDDKDNPWSR